MATTQPVDVALGPTACWHDFRQHPGDPACRSRLAEHYLPLVAGQVERMARRLPRQITARELLGAGVVGLYEALEHFTGDALDTFPAFAAKRIRGAVLDELRRLDPLTRDQRHGYHLVCATIARLTAQLKHTPTFEEIAVSAGMPVAKVAWMLEFGRQPLSLHGEGPDGRPLIDSVAASDELGPCELAHRSLARERLRACFRQLPVRDQQLLYLRLYADLRVAEIAAAMGVSEGRVSQLYKQAVERLRALMFGTAPACTTEE